MKLLETDLEKWRMLYAYQADARFRVFSHCPGVAFENTLQSNEYNKQICICVHGCVVVLESRMIALCTF